MSEEPKLFIGPVSKSIVEATIKIANREQVKLGLIPSRRQVDYCGGYTGWNTQDFCRYVKSKSEYVVLERDHGGSNQGQFEDHGVISFLDDVKHFDVVHIDPFKSWNNILEVANETVIHLQYLHYQNPKISFEIGTESGIMPYTVEKYRQFLDYVWEKSDSTIIDRILYLVVQGGTEVKEGKNIGHRDSEQLIDFIRLCNSYGKLSKEHNGDYLTLEEIRQKFGLGLSAINIAPEFGTIESEVLWGAFEEEDREAFFELAVSSKRWKKWFNYTFNPAKNQELLIRMCGHYVFEHPELKAIKEKYPGLEEVIAEQLEGKIVSILEALK